MVFVAALAGVGIVIWAREIFNGPYHTIGEVPPLYVTEYEAVIGPEEKVDDAGNTLLPDQMILVRDRMNVEDRGIRQPGDSMSCRRPSAGDRSQLPLPAERWAILGNAQVYGTDEALQTLRGGERPIHVTIYFKEDYGRYFASAKLAEGGRTR